MAVSKSRPPLPEELPATGRMRSRPLYAAASGRVAARKAARRMDLIMARQYAAVASQKAEGRRQRAESRGQKAGVGSGRLGASLRDPTPRADVVARSVSTKAMLNVEC